MINVKKRYSKFGGGIQNPNRLIIHAMAQFIEIDQAGSDYYSKLGITLPVGAYHASEFLERIGLSAHFLLEPNGDFIKLRHTKEIAYHAKGNNTNTVGIEVLVQGTFKYGDFINEIKKDWVTEIQYVSLVEMSNGIIEYFDIKTEDVLRHSDIDPERKKDPGSGFKWGYYKSLLI